MLLLLALILNNNYCNIAICLLEMIESGSLEQISLIIP